MREITPTTLPNKSQSYWIESTELPSFPALQEDLSADVVIVGAGIAGLTTAYLLAQEGTDVVLLEADRVLRGTTGHTTAKISTQHHLIYDELIRNFGVDGAKRYYEANRDAMGFIRHIVDQHSIDCNLTNQDACVYAVSDKGLKLLEAEQQAYAKLGIEGDWVDSLPLPAEAGAQAGLVLRNHAQFHPLRYLKHLLEAAVAAGVRVYEQTPAYVIDTEQVSEPIVKTKNGKTIRSRKLVVTTHYPFCDGIGAMFARLYAVKSYVVAIEPKRAYPGGMYISTGEQPTHSLREVETDGRKLILVSGENHRTGAKLSTLERYENLRELGDRLFGVQSIPYRWSAQDIIPPDKVPYIGPVTKELPNIYVATAFHKWGMTNGTAAGRMIADHIAGRDNPYAELFSPSRFEPKPDLWKLVKQNAHTAVELITGKLEHLSTAGASADSLRPDEGAVVHHEGQRAGAYRDPSGALYIVDTTCTHMGCELNWNDGERTWDCPCHGSRFDYKGGVIEGPAITALKLLSSQAAASGQQE